MGHTLRAFAARIAVPGAAAALLVSCAPKPPTPEQIASEKRAVSDVVAQYLKAYAAKDSVGVLAAMADSGELLFFGTDSAEVIRSKDDWRAQMRADWALMDSARAGAIRRSAVAVAASGDLAFEVGEAPMDMYAGKRPAHALWRFAFGLRKVGGRWGVAYGIGEAATVGQSSAELVAKAQQARKR